MIRNSEFAIPSPASGKLIIPCCSVHIQPSINFLFVCILRQTYDTTFWVEKSSSLNELLNDGTRFGIPVAHRMTWNHEAADQILL